MSQAMSSTRRGPIRALVSAVERVFSRASRHPRAAIGVVILGAFVMLAIAPGLVTGAAETVLTASGRRLEPPSARHLLGTDEIGRDLLNLVVHGARISMLVGLTATAASAVLGTVVGTTAGLLGGRVDALLMRTTDVALVIPVFVLAIVVAPLAIDAIGASTTVLGLRASLIVTIAVLAIGGWPITARVIRSQTLTLRERAFVEWVWAAGGGRAWILRRHIVPNVLGMTATMSILGVSGAISAETGLAFIGLGDPFQPSWGQLLNSAERAGAAALGAWWYVGAPGACVALVVLACTLLGSELAEVTGEDRP
jgi:peptide/nickel transport system permease protein